MSKITEPPTEMLVDAASEEIGTAIINVMKKYSMSAALLDMALTQVVAKIKDMKANEYAINAVENYKKALKDGSTDG